MDRRGITLLALTAALSGCGALFTHGPPAGYEQTESFKCSESKALPTLDIVLGTTILASGFVIGADPEAYGYPANTGGTIVATGVVEALILGVSAAVGFDKVKRCRAALDELAARQARARAAAAPRGTLAEYVNVSPGADTIAVGAMVQLNAAAFGGDRPLLDQPLFTWSSSNEAVAWVTRTGLVTALAPGTTVIAARTIDDVIGTATVVVTAR